MKTTMFTIVVAMLFAAPASAQFDASNLSGSLSGNYTMYKGEFQKSTPGAKIDLGYSITEKIRVSLGYTYHLPIKEASSIYASNGMDLKSLASEIKYNFMTIGVAMNYTFIGTEEDVFSVYTPVGANYVSAKYKEVLTEAIPDGYAAQDAIEPGKETGFTLNFGLGTQYNAGGLRFFGDAGIALAANQTNGQYVENNIPAHFVFNVGVRIPFGPRDSY